MFTAVAGDYGDGNQRSEAAWAPRIASGMDALVASATNGKGAMPPKGACADCSADDVAAAVEHMVSNSQ